MQEYEIASMYLLEKYWTGDGVTTDTASIEENNSSAFNYRVVPGTNHLSNHARGYAIDLNRCKIHMLLIEVTEASEHIIKIWKNIWIEIQELRI